MLREIDLEKKSTKSDLLSKATDINDRILLQRFKKIKETEINYDSNDEDQINNNNNNSNNGGFANPFCPPSSPINFNNDFQPSLFQQLPSLQQPFFQPQQTLLEKNFLALLPQVNKLRVK